MNPYRPDPIHKRPKGIYRASSWDYSCDRCAYQGKGNYCTIRKEAVTDAHKMKCAEWMDSRKGIVEVEP